MIPSRHDSMFFTPIVFKILISMYFTPSVYKIGPYVLYINCFQDMTIFSLYQLLSRQDQLFFTSNVFKTRRLIVFKTSPYVWFFFFFKISQQFPQRSIQNLNCVSKELIAVKQVSTKQEYRNLIELFQEMRLLYHKIHHKIINQSFSVEHC